MKTIKKHSVYEVEFVLKKDASAPVMRQQVVAKSIGSLSEYYEPAHEILQIKLISSNTETVILESHS